MAKRNARDTIVGLDVGTSKVVAHRRRGPPATASIEIIGIGSSSGRAA
jgi:cell division ATPase FtsA